MLFCNFCYTFPLTLFTISFHLKFGTNFIKCHHVSQQRLNDIIFKRRDVTFQSGNFFLCPSKICQKNVPSQFHIMYIYIILCSSSPFSRRDDLYHTALYIPASYEKGLSCSLFEIVVSPLLMQSIVKFCALCECTDSNF